MTFKNLLPAGFIAISLVSAAALDIKFPPETGAFKQGPGAELANGQCLICHSVEYVTMQPPNGRAFWKAEVTKMQQKYAAPIPDAEIDAVTDYLTKTYGIWTNGPSTAPSLSVATTVSATSTNAGLQLATKYGCIGCHGNKLKIVGPPYHEVALKYASDPHAIQKIDEQIHKGGSGKWGPVIMPPFPQIGVEETKILAAWILSLK